MCFNTLLLFRRSPSLLAAALELRASRRWEQGERRVKSLKLKHLFLIHFALLRAVVAPVALYFGTYMASFWLIFLVCLLSFGFSVAYFFLSKQVLGSRTTPMLFPRSEDEGEVRVCESWNSICNASAENVERDF